MSELAELQRVLDGEIPMCGQMGIRVASPGELADLPGGGPPSAGSPAADSPAAGPGAGGLWMTMPLDRNRNHQRTAFAGSLNALCTIAGWGAAWLELDRFTRRSREQGGPPVEGAVVIRRSSIKYHEPVDSPVIVARCLPPDADRLEFFTELLAEKGQSKLDLSVEIAGRAEPAVSFQGSYVVVPPEPAA